MVVFTAWCFDPPVDGAGGRLVVLPGEIGPAGPEGFPPHRENETGPG